MTAKERRLFVLGLVIIACSVAVVWSTVAFDGAVLRYVRAANGERQAVRAFDLEVRAVERVWVAMRRP